LTRRVVPKALIKTAADEKAIRDGCYFEAAAAERVRRFFAGYLRHSKGRWAGQAFTFLPWQWDDVIRPIFGWKRADGSRRFRTAYIEVPKKNGKSELGAGISLYLLVGDGEAGPEVYSAAADRFQATIVHDEAARMVQQSPALSKRLRIVDTQKTIVYPARHGRMKALSADVPTKEGLNFNGLTFDELHAQRTRDLWDTLRYGGAARRQPLIFIITTAGWDRHSICYEQHEYAQKVLDGIIEDTSFFAYIRAAKPDAEWRDADVWRAANPSMGAIIDEESFAAECKEAEESPTKENTFKRYRLNIWTQQETRLLPMVAWDECNAEVDRAELEGQECWAGLDLASTQDVCAFLLYFPAQNAILPTFWVPEENAYQRERRDRVPYETWARQGLLNLTEGNTADHERIATDIEGLGKVFNIRDIGFDRWGSQWIQTRLQAAGFGITQFGQGFKDMSAPTKELLKLVLNRQLKHGGNPVLRWMASNVAAETDAADNVKPSKKHSTERIDGIVALIMAIGRAMGGAEQASTYEERGIVYV